jgi:hypothetical protein
MNRKSVSESSFFNPRALIGFVPRSIGLLLVVLGLIAFPNSSALATQCEEVVFSEDGYTPDTIYVSLSTGTSGATIFVRYSHIGPPPNPTHNGSTPTNGTGTWVGPYFEVPYGTRLYIKALAYKAGFTDSIVTSYWVDNSGD